jgi:hypothetical protein
MYDYSTAYNVRRGTHDELKVLAFRAGLQLGKPGQAATRQAVRIKMNSGAWLHGWLRVRPVVVGLAFDVGSKRMVKSFTPAQMRAAVAEGSIELSYTLRSRG